MLLRTQLLGYETERSEMERWKILHSAKDLKQKKRNVKRSAKSFTVRRIWVWALLIMLKDFYIEHFEMNF